MCRARRMAATLRCARPKRGDVFYGCVNYPKCDFATNLKLVDETCPKCDQRVPAGGVERGGDVPGVSE